MHWRQSKSPPQWSWSSSKASRHLCEGDYAARLKLLNYIQNGLRRPNVLEFHLVGDSGGGGKGSTSFPAARAPKNLDDRLVENRICIEGFRNSLGSAGSNNNIDNHLEGTNDLDKRQRRYGDVSRSTCHARIVTFHVTSLIWHVNVTRGTSHVELDTCHVTRDAWCDVS